jgi:hypothetical protein
VAFAGATDLLGSLAVAVTARALGGRVYLDGCGSVGEHVRPTHLFRLVHDVRHILHLRDAVILKFVVRTNGDVCDAR